MLTAAATVSENLLLASAWPNPVDHAVLDAMLAIRVRPLTVLMLVITTVGGTVAMSVAAVVGTVWSACIGRREWAWTIALTTIAGFAAMNGLKAAFGRHRPPEPPALVHLSTASFPSGHAMMSATVLGILAAAVVSGTARRWPIALAAVTSAAIGMSRVYLGAHWMTDVAAGWALGAMLAIIGWWATTAVRPAHRERRASRPDVAP